MATSTHRITVTNAKYENLSNGNLCCTLIIHGQVQLVVGGAEPDIDTPDFIALSGPSGESKIISFENLELEDDVFARATNDDELIEVVRGPARVML